MFMIKADTAYCSVIYAICEENECQIWGILSTSILNIHHAFFNCKMRCISKINVQWKNWLIDWIDQIISYLMNLSVYSKQVYNAGNLPTESGTGCN